MRVWNWMVMTRVLRVTDRYAGTGFAVDHALSYFNGPTLTIAQLVGFSVRPFGVRLPELDSQLIAAAQQYGAELPVGSGLRVPGSLLVRSDGVLALALDRTRTIESAGTFPVIVAEPEAGRYLFGWEIPGVIYMGGMT